MKIKVEQLSHNARSAIVECLRKVGGTRNAVGTPYSLWHVELAMRIEHGELLLCKYVYDEQEGGEK